MSETPSDQALLAECARGSAEAVRQAVERHATLVYSAAFRVLGNRPDAEDASQIVFSIFQRKAATLPAETVLAGWLHRTTWFVAQALKDEAARRRRREKEVAAMRSISTSAPDAWPELRPLLDEALNALPDKSRIAVILHHLEGQSLREVGQAIGCSEDAARKRIDWALSKMRARLERRGVILATGLLAATLSAHAAESVPPSLLSTMGSEPVFAALKTEHQHVAEEAMRAMCFSDIRITYVSAAAIVFMLLLAAVMLAGDTPPAAPAATPAAQQPADAPNAPQGAWSVKGVVTDAAGKPIEGAFVAVGGLWSYQTMGRRHQEPWRSLAKLTRPFFDHEPRGPSAMTNAKGEYVIAGIQSAVQGSVYAYHPDYAPTCVEIDRKLLTDNGEIRFPPLVIREGNSISGKVTDEAGNALARAYVAVQPAVIHSPDDPFADGRPPYEYALGDVRVVRSDEKGAFSIRGLVPMAYDLAAWTDDRPPVARSITATGSDGEQVVIALKPGKTLRVKTVVLPDRQPLAGCYTGVEGLEWMRTNERGECLMAGLPDGEHVVLAGPPEGSAFHGSAPRATYTFEYAQRKTCQAGGDVTFEFLPATTLRVKLIDAETRAPVKEARIRLDPQRDAESGKYGDFPALANSNTTTAPDGIFSIEHVRRAQWKVRVLGNGYFPESKQIALPLEGLKEPIEISLQPGKTALRGRVVDAHTGKALGGVKVSAYEWFYEFGDGNRQETVTRDDGSYEIQHLLGGEQGLRVEFSRQKYASEVVKVEVETQRKPNEVDEWPAEKCARVWFQKDTGRPSELAEVRLAMQSAIRGVVRAADGKPMQNYGIRLYFTGVAKNLKASIAGGTHTAVDGSFEITLPAGNYDLVYGHHDWQKAQPLELKPGATLKLDLQSDGSQAVEDF